jgi:hypothetical protein
VLIYPNTFIQGQYVYIIKQLARYWHNIAVFLTSIFLLFWI